MNAVLLWKEYRQQRALWLTMLLLAAFLAISLNATLQRREASVAVDFLLMSIAVTYGVVVGALATASEKEDGTLDFLDTHAGKRAPVWSSKLAMGAALMLSQSLALATLALIVGLGYSNNALTMFAAGLNGIAWGLLAGALCRKVLVAVLTGIAFMLGSWAVSFVISMFALPIFGVEAALAFAALGASFRCFCRDDLSRRPAQPPRRRPPVRIFPRSWRVVLWIIRQQGRWALAAIGAGTLLLGFLMMIHGLQLLVWPAGSLTLGVICGLTTFSPDQLGKQFVASQRVPLGRYWTVRTIFWLLVLLAATASAWFLGTGLHSMYESEAPSYLIPKWTGWDFPRGAADPALLVVIWPLYGFCLGHFVGILIQRTAVALFLVVVLAPVTAGLLALSLVLGGVSPGWVLIIPILLLLTSRLSMRAWASGRLLTRRLIVMNLFSITLMAACLSAFFWRRATEVVDVGAPFDVIAYIASLPSPEKNPADQLIRHALTGLKEQKKKIEHDRGWPSDPKSRAMIEKLELGSVREVIDAVYASILANVRYDGWPAEDNWIGAWLDQLFEGEWAVEIQKVSQLPLGTLQDPRLIDGSKWPTPIFELGKNCRWMSDLLIARGLQLQARGDSRGALNQLETALAISRQLRNNALHEQFAEALAIESAVLEGYRRWLDKLGPQPVLLRAGLAMLQRHEETCPSLRNSIQTEYLDASNDQHSVRLQFSEREGSEATSLGARSKRLAREFQNIACEIPWEKERQNRLLNAFIASELQIDPEAAWNGQSGFPLNNGPGASLDEQQWNHLLDQFQITHRYLSGALMRTRLDFARQRRRLHAAQIVTALGLYYADHKHAPAQLIDLVPAFFTSVPIDGVTGRAFGYRISDGEQIERSSGDQPIKLAPGEALLFAERLRFVPEFYMPAAAWMK